MRMRFFVTICQLKVVENTTSTDMNHRTKYEKPCNFRVSNEYFYVCVKGLCVRGFENVRCTSTTSLSVIDVHRTVYSTIHEFVANVG